MSAKAHPLPRLEPQVEALAELGRTPAEITDVVISHADVDHYGGNSEV